MLIIIGINELASLKAKLVQDSDQVSDRGKVQRSGSSPSAPSRQQESWATTLVVGHAIFHQHKKFLIITIVAAVARRSSSWKVGLVGYAAEEMVGDICHLCLASTLCGAVQ